MPTETQLLLLFWMAILVGVALGGWVGWRRGMIWGVAFGCLVIGAGSSTAAGLMAWQRWQFISAAQLVQGTLLYDRDGPQVEFFTPDGAKHEVHGLGGSQDDKSPGDRVPVRVPGDDPAQALVADFQNLWGGVLAFTLFGVLPLAFGAFFFGVARSESSAGSRRLQTARPPVEAPSLSPMRRRLAGNLTIAGNVVMLGGFAIAFFAHDDLASIGRPFLVIGLGATLFAMAFWMRRAGDWQAPAICLIVALGFDLFGGAAMLIGAH